jgi:hypothetical protein
LTVSSRPETGCAPVRPGHLGPEHRTAQRRLNSTRRTRTKSPPPATVSGLLCLGHRGTVHRRTPCSQRSMMMMGSSV